MSKLKIDIKELEEFLKSNEIPSVKQQPKTFLEIARQPHYENVISNIYAFYFDPHEEHGLGHLFIDSFIECIKDSLKQQVHELNATEFRDDFQDFIIETEYGTQDKGRIDLFLYNDEQAIIIENKIYHHLANNLSDYWDTAKKNRKGKMVGVLLTLSAHKGSLHSKFVNILHLDFLQKVMANIGSHLMEASEKYVTFLKDLYQNIENMSTKQLSTDNFKFYIENQDKIVETVKFNDLAKDHIKTQIVDAFNDEPNLKVKKATQNTYQFYSYREIEHKEVKDIFFSVFFDLLMTSDKTFYIDIHIKDKGPYAKYYNHQEIRAILKSHPHMDLAKSERKDDGWIYLADREYVLSNEELENLKETITKKLEEDEFLMLFDKLSAKLEELKRMDKEA